jgi:hypothetical protein
MTHQHKPRATAQETALTAALQVSTASPLHEGDIGDWASLEGIPKWVHSMRISKSNRVLIRINMHREA